AQTVLPIGLLVYKDYGGQGPDVPIEPDHKLEAQGDRGRKVWKLAGQCERLEPFPIPLLGDPFAYMAHRRWYRANNYWFRCGVKGRDEKGDRCRSPQRRYL